MYVLTRRQFLLSLQLYSLAFPFPFFLPSFLADVDSNTLYGNDGKAPSSSDSDDDDENDNNGGGGGDQNSDSEWAADDVAYEEAKTRGRVARAAEAAAKAATAGDLLKSRRSAKVE